MSTILRKLGEFLVRNDLDLSSQNSLLFRRFDELSALKTLLVRNKIDCIIDVGANVGQFGRDCRGVGYNGWIFSFEPSPSEYVVLRKRLDDRWIAENIALGSVAGKFPMNIESHSPMNSFLDPIGRDVVSKIEVSMSRLDDVFDRIRSISQATNFLLKCDTQGYDLQVFRGASSSIKHISALISEVSILPLYDNMPSLVESLQTYSEAGFGVHSLHPVTLNSDRSAVEYNVFMIKVG